MSQDDPNNPAPPEGDRTILVPSPGRRRAAAAAAAVPAAAPAAAPPPAAAPAQMAPGYAPPPLAGTPIKLDGRGVNPLVAAANPLLDLVVPLRVMAMHGNVEGLRQQLVGAIKTFESAARAAGVEHETVAAARYALCTFLDETISSTPWGGSGVWASRSLLVAFHNEAFGGEKFFLILQRLCQAPRVNLHVLELFYLCLALGLEGRYRVIDGGRNQLDTLRERLQQLIQKERGAYEPDLSLHWQGSNEQRGNLRRLIPLWIIIGVLSLLLLAVHLFLHARLARIAEPVYLALGQINVANPQPPAAPPVNPPVRVAQFLAPDIAAGRVSVTETDDVSTITLHGEGVFGSGKSEVLDGFDPLLERIGKALKNVPGNVRVTGFTDDVPSKSTRFPSNWELSRARASTVVTKLAAQAGPPARYAAFGKGALDPVVPNNSALNRARNRRVVIEVFTPVLTPTKVAR